MRTGSWQRGGLALLLVACAGKGSPGAGESPARSKAKAEAAPDVYGALCKAGPTPFGDVVLPIAEDLQAQKVWYNSTELSDCSGIFHRVLLSYQEQCPNEPLAKADVDRTSRQLGSWYLNKGLLTVIADPVAEEGKIQPGTVLFYGPNGRDYPAMDPADAMEAIVHVGVVVDTTLNPDGTLQSYRLFHGRRDGTYASITDWHGRDADPPFGNGTDEIIGAAPIATPMGQAPPRSAPAAAPAASSQELVLTCKRKPVAASALVLPVAEELRGETIRVRWGNERDKVRVLTLLSERIAADCPELVVPPEEAGESYGKLAQWYVAEGRFHVVDRATDRADWIVPGSVMFFGPASVNYKGLDPEDVLAKVDHLGVVVSVTRDASDRVTGYTLFQAPPGGGFAAEFVEANPGNSRRPFGLDGVDGAADRVWVGVAPIASQSKGRNK